MTKSPETNSPVPSMKKQRSASPSQAMPMSAFCATTASTMSRRFSSMSGFASWFGNRPSMSKQSLVVRQGSRSNSFGATSPPMPLPASSTTLNGLMIDGSMNDMTWSTYGVEHVLRRHAAAARRRRRQPVCRNHVADVGDAFVAAQRKRLAADHLHAVVLLRVVRRGDLDAAVVAVRRDREVEHVGRNHPVVDDVGALRGGAVDERGRERRRRQPHVAPDGDPFRLQIRDERRADGARGLFVDLARIHAADVVGLEDSGVQVHFQLSALSSRLSAALADQLTAEAR